MSSFVPPKLRTQPSSLRVVSGSFAIPPFRVVCGPFTTTLLPSMNHPSLAAPEGLCRLVSLDKSHGRALLHQLCKPLRVPIGQANAAMGLRLADLAGIWRAVDPLARGQS